MVWMFLTSIYIRKEIKNSVLGHCNVYPDPFSDIVLFANESRKLSLTLFTGLELMSIGVKGWRQCLYTWDCQYRNNWTVLWMKFSFLKAKREVTLSLKPHLVWRLALTHSEMNLAKVILKTGYQFLHFHMKALFVLFHTKKQP